jgi:SRSO17 transposase
MVSNTVRGRKAKGRDFQKEIAEIIRTAFNLEERDVVSTPASVSGEDILLSEKAKNLFPFNIEAKRQEKWNIPAWWKQTTDNSKDNRKPLLVFRRNHGETLCCLKFEDFMRLIK